MASNRKKYSRYEIAIKEAGKDVLRLRGGNLPNLIELARKKLGVKGKKKRRR